MVPILNIKPVHHDAINFAHCHQPVQMVLITILHQSEHGGWALGLEQHNTIHNVVADAVVQRQVKHVLCVWQRRACVMSCQEHGAFSKPVLSDRCIAAERNVVGRNVYLVCKQKLQLIMQ